jgi:hypothetical protein
VLNFSTSDFHASSKVDLKYAEAYTLVHFFLHGDQGQHWEAFDEVLVGAYAGKCSSTYFEQCLDLPERDFEQAWHAYVGR